MFTYIRKIPLTKHFLLENESFIEGSLGCLTLGSKTIF